MHRTIRLSFPDDHVSCEAALLDDAAPQTCAMIWEHLPLEGRTVHGMYSGPELYITAHHLPDVELENGMHRPLPGDVGYWCNEPGKYAMEPERAVEILFIYDRGAAIMGADGQPTFANLFAQVTGDWEEFRHAARKVLTEGPKRFCIERVE